MKKRPPPKTRVVGYTFEGDFDESAMEIVLERAKTAGAVTEFDTGRGHVVWFNGPPGPALRKVWDQVKAIVERGS